MSWIVLVRSLGLMLPLVLTVAVVAWRRGHRRRTLGGFLAAAWNAPALLALNVLAARVGWWRFEVEGGTLLGVPVDLWLAWCLLWGPLPALLLRRWPLPVVLGLLLGVDVLLMPWCAPVVVLGPGWLWGEALALAVCALPGLLLARWTRDDAQLGPRVLLLAGAFAGLTLGVVPAAVLQETGGSWGSLSALTGTQLAVTIQLLLLVAVPALSAVQEFAERGGGTPLPYDPPRVLIRSGPYAYLANPMQTFMAALLVAWGGVLHSAPVALAGAMTVAFGASVAAWQERGQLSRRYGEAWSSYRGGVRAFVPRWRPHAPPPATLYYAADCGPCEQLMRWLSRKQPAGVRFVPAQQHPSRDLARVTYAADDGLLEAEGLIAVLRVLEHVNLLWAYLSWLLRLPGISHVARVLSDVASGGPNLVPRTGPSLEGGDEAARTG
ncbi:MAG: DUF393 domain-containing protein [Planctomycetes bacterium]|nr:DUF393 domain-containing protein [Planctomycetota bacterium]